MLVDLILDRMEGQGYNPKSLYNYCMGYDYASYQNVTRALDAGSEKDVKRALCSYIEGNGYNPDIISYIMSVNWSFYEYKVTYLEFNKIAFVRIADDAILYSSNSEQLVSTFAHGFCTAKGCDYYVE